jgi:hypothetical protein
MRIYLSLLVLLVVAVVSGLYFFVENDVNDPSYIAHEQAPKNLTPKSPVNLSQHNDSNDALQLQIHELERQVAELRKKVHTTHIEKGALESNVKPVVAGQAELSQLRDEYNNKLAMDFNSEPIDTIWAKGHEASLSEVIASFDKPALIKSTVECRSKTCRIEVNSDSGENMQGMVYSLADKGSRILPQVQVVTKASGNDGYTALYFQRDKEAESISEELSPDLIANGRSIAMPVNDQNIYR